MSELRANTISDAAGTGPVALTKQWAAKAVTTYNHVTQAILASENTASCTDDGAGRYTANWTNNFGAATYATMATTSQESGAVQSNNTSLDFQNGSITTSSASFSTQNMSAGYADKSHNSLSMMGDLA